MGKAHPVSATVDYMSYLMQQPDILEDELPDAPLDDEDEELEEDFDDELDDFEEEAPAKPLAVEVEKDQNVQTDPYFTETLAHIYIKQGKYNKAIEIIRRLSLNVPEKNRYFADQTKSDSSRN